VVVRRSGLGQVDWGKERKSRWMSVRTYGIAVLDEVEVEVGIMAVASWYAVRSSSLSDTPVLRRN
jgi:hypothetical protein